MCLLFLMSVLSVDFKQSKMIHLLRVWRKFKADFSRLVWQSANVLKERCHFICLCYFLSGSSKSKACHFCFLSAAPCFLCKNHKVFALLPRRTVLNVSMLWVEWVAFRGTWIGGSLCLDTLWGGAWGRPLAIAGLWFQVRLWTHAARSWMPPPSSRDIRSGGSYINTASWPPSLTPRAPLVSSVPWPSEPWNSAELHMLQVSFTERQIEEQRDRQADIFTVCNSSAAVTLSRVGPALALSLSLKPQGTRQ